MKENKKFVIYVIRGIDRIGIYETNDYDEAVDFCMKSTLFHLIDVEEEAVLF